MKSLGLCLIQIQEKNKGGGVDLIEILILCTDFQLHLNNNVYGHHQLCFSSRIQHNMVGGGQWVCGWM